MVVQAHLLEAAEPYQFQTSRRLMQMANMFFLEATLSVLGRLLPITGSAEEVATQQLNQAIQVAMVLQGLFLLLFSSRFLK
jgi:hypothetical protein